MLTGIIIPLAVFFWLYKESKDKNKTIIEISKHLDDRSKLDELLRIFDERKKEPIDYRRNGVITIFVRYWSISFWVILHWRHTRKVLELWLV